MSDPDRSSRERRAFKARHGMRSSGGSLKRTLLPLIAKATKRKRGKRGRKG